MTKRQRPGAKRAAAVLSRMETEGRVLTRDHVLPSATAWQLRRQNADGTIDDSEVAYALVIWPSTVELVLEDPRIERDGVATTRLTGHRKDVYRLKR